MLAITSLYHDIAWPLALLAAWGLGEVVQRWMHLPRVCAYALVGFVLAPSLSGWLPAESMEPMLLLANIAFGLMLFECGYRINLHWLRASPWMVASGLLVAMLSFAGVYVLLTSFAVDATAAALMAALAMATSPAAVLWVVNEQRCAGQATERLQHLSALNCVLAVCVFNGVLALDLYQSTGRLWHATLMSLLVLFASVFAGGVAALLVLLLLRLGARSRRDGTLVFAVAVIALVTLMHSLRLSPIVATLTLGLAVRHGRVLLSPSERGFGALGELLSLLLFVYVGAALDAHQVLSGLLLGLAIIAVRLLAQTVSAGLLAHVGGISLRKGLLIGLASAPLSVFAVLTLAQTRHVGVALGPEFAPLRACALVLAVLGPLLTRQALIWAREASPKPEN